jgi:hypothetical protein
MGGGTVSSLKLQGRLNRGGLFLLLAAWGLHTKILVWGLSGDSNKIHERPAFMKGVDPSGPYEVGSVDPSWTLVGPLDPSTSCENVDTTSNDKNLNENELDLAAEALKQLAVKKKSLAS